MKVCIQKNQNIRYDNLPPFSPPKKYPEYPFHDLNPENSIYSYIRNIFYKLGMDQENYGKRSWNPLGEIINPGDTVLIKPNFVRDYNFNKRFKNDVLISNGSIIRVLIDYGYIALKGEGNLIIADAPIQSANFKKIIEISGVKKIKELYKDEAELNLNVFDLRNFYSYRENGMLITKPLKGDPLGYSLIDLKKDSELDEISDDYLKFRVTNYDKEKMIKYHNKINHSYLISNTVLNSDIIINIPKLKTHKKAGFTCALKNIVGTSLKESLPHHRTHSIEEGGDEYLHKDLRKRLLSNIIEKLDNQNNIFSFIILQGLFHGIFSSSYFKKFKDNYFEGSWYGNDTIPRTISDLNRILFYSDKNGILKDEMQRKMFILVDAVIAGEGEGPLNPSPKELGILIGGYNPLAVDLVCSKLIGYKYKNIPKFRYLMKENKYSLNFNLKNLEIITEDCNDFNKIYETYGDDFLPPESWKGYS